MKFQVLLFQHAPLNSATATGGFIGAAFLRRHTSDRAAASLPGSLKARAVWYKPPAPSCLVNSGHPSDYPAWWTNILPWKITIINGHLMGKSIINGQKSLFLMGKSTISMAIFNCYVSSPVTIPLEGCWDSKNSKASKQHIPIKIGVDGLLP